MQTIIFVHGMFQNPKSWTRWVEYFRARGYECIAPAWPFHEGDPAQLRAAPPAGLGTLGLEDLVEHMAIVAAQYESPLMIGHSVGGLITQLLLNRGSIAAGVAICSVAPNAMLDLDWGMLKNSAIIANPLKGDEPVMMDEKTFHEAFANTLGESAAAQAFAEFATHDSRNVFRDCLGPAGRLDFDTPHGPLLLIGAAEDQIVPVELTRRNAKAYAEGGGSVSHQEFANRSHFICGEPGWEDVAAYVDTWLDGHAPGRSAVRAGAQRTGQSSSFRP